jgi:hypothetical protein
MLSKKTYQVIKPKTQAIDTKNKSVSHVVIIDLSISKEGSINSTALMVNAPSG